MQPPTRHSESKHDDRVVLITSHGVYDPHTRSLSTVKQFEGTQNLDDCFTRRSDLETKSKRSTHLLDHGYAVVTDLGGTANRNSDISDFMVVREPIHFGT